MSVLRGSAYALSAQVVTVTLAVVTSIVVSRELGPSGRGTLALFGVCLQTALSLATLGVSFSFAYFAGKRRFPLEALHGAAIAISLILGGSIALVALPAARWLLATVLRGLEPWQLALALGVLPFALLALILQSVMLGQGRVEEISTASVVRAALLTAALIVLVAGLDFGAGAAIVAMALANVWQALWYGWRTISRHGVAFRGLSEVVRQAFSYGLKAYPGSLSSHFWLRADVYVLNSFQGPAAVGQYTLATSLAEKVWILEGSVMQAVLPQVISRERAAAASLAARTARALVLLGGALSLVLAALSPWIVPLVYGEEFRPSVLPLIILLPGAIALSVSRVFAGYYSGQLGRPLVPTTVAVSTALVSAVLYAALIPWGGLIGAAAASSLAYGIPLAIYLRRSRPDLGLPVRDFLLANRDDARLLRASAARLFRRFQGAT